MNEFSQYAAGLHEECGVFGMYDKTGETDMVSAVYSALYALQHRGQESCGIALNVDGVLSGYRDLGLVSEVFTKRVLEDLPHGAKNGYRPRAVCHRRAAQPFQRAADGSAPLQGVPWPSATTAIWSTHPAAPQAGDEWFHLPRHLRYRGHCLSPDPEPSADPPNIEMAVSRTMDDIEGAYSLVIMTHTKLIAARD